MIANHTVFHLNAPSRSLHRPKENHFRNTAFQDTQIKQVIKGQTVNFNFDVLFLGFELFFIINIFDVLTTNIVPNRKETDRQEKVLVPLKVL